MTRAITPSWWPVRAIETVRPVSFPSAVVPRGNVVARRADPAARATSAPPGAPSLRDSMPAGTPSTVPASIRPGSTSIFPPRDGAVLAEAEERGRARGRDEARAELRPLADGLRYLMDELERERARVLETAERELVELALLVARLVVARELEASPELAVELAREGIAALVERDAVVVRLWSDGARAIPPRRAEALATSAGAGSVRVVEEPTWEPGRCVVESSAGRVEAGVADRLRALSEAMTGAAAGDDSSAT